MAHGHGGGQGGISYSQHFFASSISPAIAALFTNPLEVAKVDLNRPNLVDNLGTINTLVTIYKNEGVRGMQAGLPIAVVREGTKNLFRIGAFEPILHLLHQEKTSAPTWKKLAAGAGSGFVGAFICNPIELVKTRLQSEACENLAKLVGRQQFGYTGIGNAFYRMYHEEGIVGMWKGTAVSMWRSAAWTAVHMTSYTSFKEYGISSGYKDGSALHATCSVASAFAAVSFANPLDVVRARLYNQAGGVRLYSSALDCVAKIYASEGLIGFYKGFWQHFLRSGPHFLITFVLMEQIKIFLGKKNAQRAVN